jgi:hypothetical protein
MIVLGIILLLIGFLAKIAIIWTLGIIALAAGLILLLLGSMGRAVGGRRHYWYPRRARIPAGPASARSVCAWCCQRGCSARH